MWEGRIPATLSRLWETLGAMLSKIDVIKFCNPSWLDIWTFWLRYPLQYAKRLVLSKHLEANFKRLLGLELATDVIFLVLSSVSNDSFIYVFATSVGCEIRYVGTTELKNIPYINARVTCTINFSVKETWMLKLKIWMLSFLEGSK